MSIFICYVCHVIFKAYHNYHCLLTGKDQGP